MSKQGAQFRKTDLQLHSPRDANWDGVRPEDSLPKGASLEEIKQARQDFCVTFIEHCISKGLNAISITDHHEGVYVYEALEALADLRSRDPATYGEFWIFPGMELTCRDACQALIIFDSNLPQALFEKARSKLGLPADIRPLESKGIEVELLTANLEDLQALLADDAELTDRFIILPHVKPEGHKTVLRRGFHKRFKDMPYVGGYMDQARPDDLSDGDRRILDGEIPAWASEKRGVISTSDARHADLRLIGDHATWIKMATATAESIRQAMLAPDSRIRHTEPVLPEAIICELSLKGSTYLADGKYAFNQQMNSVIGGRGAGKSTLLEYIRFALGCSAVDDEQTSQASSTQRLKEILEGTLDPNDGEVSLSILLNAAPVCLTRTVAKQEVIRVESDGTSSLSSPANVRELIPTQQFRQGELSDLARTDAESRLLKLVTAPATSRLNDNSSKLKRNSQALSEALSKAIRLSSAQLARTHAQTQLSLIKNQIENLEKQLTPDGQEPLDAIRDHEKYIRQGEALSALKRTIQRNQESLFSVLLSLKSELSLAVIGQPVFNEYPQLLSAFESIRVSLHPDGSLSSKIDELQDWLKSELDSISNAEDEWNTVLASHEHEYNNQRRSPTPTAN